MCPIFLGPAKSHDAGGPISQYRGGDSELDRGNDAMARGWDERGVGAIRRLWSGGALAGLAEGQVLERFAADRDEAAFEALVERHGPMVLGVCRRILRDPSRRRGRLPGDLPGPGPQGRLDPRPRRARPLAPRRGPPGRGEGPVGGLARRLREQTDSTAVALALAPDPVGPDLGWLLDEEIGRLPESLRLRSSSAWSRAGPTTRPRGSSDWSADTVRGRLARGRERLRERLARRGIAPDRGELPDAGDATGPDGGDARDRLGIDVEVGSGRSGRRPGRPDDEGVAHGSDRIGGAGDPGGGGRSRGGMGGAPALGPRPGQGEGARPTHRRDGEARGPRRHARANLGRLPGPSDHDRGPARDAGGKPVAGALIFVTDANGRTRGEPAIGRTVSEPDGRFTVRDFPLPVWTPDPGPIPRPTEGRFEVAGTAPGLAFTWHAVQSYRPEPRPASYKDGGQAGLGRLRRRADRGRPHLHAAGPDSRPGRG